MKIPRDVSGLHLADVLCRRWRYRKVHQVGSHMILETSDNVSHTPESEGLRTKAKTRVLTDVSTRRSVVAVLRGCGGRIDNPPAG